MFGRHPDRWLAPYAEGLLPTAQASEVAGHVFGCQRCRRALERVRVGQQFASGLAPATAAGPSWRELAPLLDQPISRPPQPLRWALAAAAAIAVTAGSLAWHGPRPVEARASAPLEAIALDAHHASTRELRTGDDQQLQRWLTAGASLELALPSSNDHRQLLGAARLASGAVALGYRLDGAPVTLVIADAKTSADRKRIRHRTEGGLDVATWTRGSRSYALVSSLPGSVACTLCHALAGPAAVL
jgi:anti-sigma factor RsiW